MWEAFRALDRQRQELNKRLDRLDACKRADLIDMRVIHLTIKYKRLVQDEEEAEEWVADVESLGVDSPGERKRENDARQALEAIRRDIRQLSAKASALDDKRWRWRFREHKAAEEQYELEDCIDKLKVALERVLVEGGD